MSHALAKGGKMHITDRWDQTRHYIVTIYRSMKSILSHDRLNCEVSRRARYLLKTNSFGPRQLFLRF